jgi:hypothetical protein
MPGPAYYDAQINIAQNVDWVVQFAIATMNSDGITTTPLDLTGSTIKMEIRVTEKDHEAIVAVWSPDDGIYFNNGDPTTGQFVIAITRDKLTRLFVGDFVADIVRYMANGYRERLIDAAVTVVKGTTR